jgi:excisionase family DNA binding protein
MNVLDETQLLTVAEVARRLQQSERTVRDKIASGVLPAVKIGTSPRAPIRVDPAELEERLAASDVTPPSAASRRRDSRRRRRTRLPPQPVSTPRVDERHPEPIPALLLESASADPAPAFGEENHGKRPEGL